MQIDYVHIFTPQLVLELKAGFTRINIQTVPQNYGSNASQKFGIINSNIGADSSALALMWFLAGDYSSIGGGFYVPIFDINNTFQYNGALTYTRGAHNIKAGASLIRRQLNYFQDQYSPQGGFIFLPTPPYFNSEANFLAGISAFSERGNLLVHPGYRTWEPSAYVQDDWRATKWLTLNLGLRYEIFTPTTEVHDQYSNFNLHTLSVEIAGKNTTSSLGVKTDYTNFSPRIGFAATAGKNTVVRGGFGLSYYPMDLQSAIQNANPPYSYACFPCFGTTFPTLPLPAATSVANPSGLVTYKPSNFRPAYIEQFNLFVQQQILGSVLSVGGVGELGRHLLYQPDFDTPAPPGPGNPTPPYVYASQLPGVTAIASNQNWATSNYYALQTSFVHRYGSGLTLNANYTWAHGLTDTVNGSGSTNTFWLVPGNIHYDYGNTDIDVRHRVAIVADYTLPFGKTLHGFAGQVVRGWQANAIAFWQTGIPFTVTNSTPRINLPGITNDRPDQIAPASLPNPSINEWFNTAAFAPQILGTPGSEGRNQVYGPNQRAINFSLLKDFPIFEQWKLQFRAECFNITNTANFALPNSSLGTPAFGTISATAANSTPREFQFALKLLF
ncbi:MAG: hypothetical protein WB992_07995 [Bryobacteraceae bacterium]